MARGRILLACLLALGAPGVASAASVFAHPPRVDAVGLRCGKAPRRIALVVRARLGDVRRRFEPVAYRFEHHVTIRARFRGPRGDLTVRASRRVAVGLVGSASVPHREVLTLSPARLRRRTGLAPCSGGHRRVHVSVRVDQRLRLPHRPNHARQVVSAQDTYADLYAQALRQREQNGVISGWIPVAVPDASPNPTVNGCAIAPQSSCPGADLAGASIQASAGYGTATVEGGFIGGPGGPISGISLSADDIDLRNADLSGATLFGVSLSQANLSGATGHGLILHGTNLVLADLAAADLTGLVAFRQPTVTFVFPQFTIMQVIDAPLVVLRAAQLSAVNFDDSLLIGADFSAANLAGASLKGVVARGADFSGASLQGASFIGADLRGADFTNADLTSANLTDANLAGADLTGAILDGATTTGAQLPS